MQRFTFRLEQMETPIGTVLIVTDAQGRLRAVDFGDRVEQMRRLLRLHYGVDGVSLVPHETTSAARDALNRYFAGDVRALDGLVVETGGTAFQRAVWAALRTIPAGQTLSYGALAVRVDRPRAVRAVGMANGANPVSIVVPCHRVIGADASLTGYGGGLERKRWLLGHEGVPLPEVRRAA